MSSINQTEYKGFIIQVSEMNVFVFSKPTATRDGLCVSTARTFKEAQAWVDAR